MVYPMLRRPFLIALAAVLCGCAVEARDAQKPIRHFTAHCEYAILPNFVIPMKSIAARDGLTYSDGEPDASGAATLVTLARPTARVLARFGQPRPNDVEVSEYGPTPGKQDDDAFGRIVALFRFCEPSR